MSDLFEDTELDLETPQDVILDPEDIPFVKVPKPFLEKFGAELGPLGITTYVGLRSFANRKRGMSAFPAVKKIAELTGMGVSTVRRELAVLERLGIISREQRVGHSTVYVITPPFYNVEDPLLQCATPPSTIDNRNKKNLIRSNLTIESAPLPDLKPIYQVFDYYIVLMGKDPKLYTLSQARLEKLKTRFAECLRKTSNDTTRATELMKLAVDGCAASDFHMGKNPNGKKYNDIIDNIFKSYEQMEKWWND